MRTCIGFLVAALGFTAALPARAEEPPKAELPQGAQPPPKAQPLPKNLVLADLGLHVVGLGYQRTLAPWVAAQVDIDSYTPWTATDGFFDVGGVVLRARAVFYPWKEAPTGVWLSPFEQCGPGWGKRAGVRHEGYVCAVGASVGYSLLLWRRVHLSIGVGAQYHVAHISGGVGAPAFHGFHQHLDASLGYAF